MSWARSWFLSFAVLGVACEDSALVTPAPPTQTPVLGTASTGNCFGSLGEVEAQWRSFPEALVREGTVCPGASYAEERHCPGFFVSIAQGDRLVLNTTRYFDGNRQLFAMRASTDTPAYCGGTSLDKIYGTLPICPTTTIVTNLCRR